jgi:hypothetical protein
MKYTPKPILCFVSLLLKFACAALAFDIVTSPGDNAHSVIISGDKQSAAVVVDSADYPVVKLAADLFAEDVNRVTGQRPTVTTKAEGSSQVVIVGTLGHSKMIDGLVASGKLRDIKQIQGHWEATLSQLVEEPLPGIKRALVIAGSDRRGTAYGLMKLSEKIGVSPWCWWADVPVAHQNLLAVKMSTPELDMPGVKYRGIFINDEDWGLQPWAAKTFDPAFKNIGPKTYAKVFEMMLRLRLNYIWPAMHACSTEFGSVPENIALADKYAIVAGASHCEPMLCNNIHWNQKERGPWNYSLNRDAIYSYWEESAKARSTQEAVWTLGIRGIHDQGMQVPPKDMPGKISLLTEIFRDQKALLNQYVTKQWGPVAQCFVPYKEVLPIYDAGLEVPQDVTLVWVDDNFGYIRRLSSPKERKRSGGAGVYWHMSYYGAPHSYTWINSVPPALMWEELQKAWENDARTMWVINVGDIKPMEIGMDYFSRLAWNPERTGPDSQPIFLRDFVVRNFGEKFAQPIADLLGEFYRLGTIHKPELMDRTWATSLPSERAEELSRDYTNLLKREAQIAESIPVQARDAYTEMVGFPVRVLGSTGLIFMADRKIQLGEDLAANESEIGHLRAGLEMQVRNFNTNVAGGKWNRMMPGLVTARDLAKWNSQVRWPWGEKPHEPGITPLQSTSQPARNWRDAASAERQSVHGQSRWTRVDGLGSTGRALALKPAGIDSAWTESDKNAPTLEYDFQPRGSDTEAIIEFLPTFRICPGMKLRVAVSVDNRPFVPVEVPGSSGEEDEKGKLRAEAIQSNCIQARVALPALSPAKHVFKIRAMDPGTVIDRVSLP